MNKEKNKSKKEFKAVEWVRSVRNKMNKRYTSISYNEYIEMINKKAREFEKKKMQAKKVS